MPIAFLVPAFLAGLAALVVPVLLHLRRRERRKPRPFPSLMFLARLPIQVDDRRRLTDWPLLLLRALAIALLVGAFARPYLTSRSVGGSDSAGLTVVLVDRSASMAAAGVRDRWQDSARAVIAGLPAGRRVAVVAFDAAATVLQSPTDDHAAAATALAAAPAPGGGTRFGAGLRAASQLLVHERVPGEIVLVTDLQRAGLAATTAPTLPAGTVFRTVAVEPDSRDNAAVTAIEVEQVASSDGRRAMIAARIDRHGGSAARQLEAVLEIDGRVASRRSLTMPPDGAVRVAFDTVSVARSEARLQVRIEHDGLPGDDVFHAVLPADAATRVLLVAPADTRPDELRYLQHALAIGRDPTFSVERVTQLDAPAIERSAVVVLLDAPPPTGALADALEQWLRAGGGVVSIPGERLAQRRGGVTLLPAVTRGNASRERGAMLGDAETSHPALSAFQGAAVDGFASVRVRRHPMIEPAPGATVLLRYDDGDPAVVAGALDAGRTMVVAIPLDVRGGDFPLQPAFLPFLRGVVSWAAGTDAGQVTALASGEPWLPPVALNAPVARDPEGELSRPSPTSRLLTLRAAGIHEIRDGSTTGLPAALVAVNAPAAESDLAALDADELLLGVGEGEAPLAAAMTVSEASTAREARQSGWRWVLVTLLGILMVEAIVASHGWRAVAIRPATDGGGQKGTA